MNKKALNFQIMDDMDEIQPNFPPLEHEKLLKHVKQRLGISKYIDFIRTINNILKEEEQRKKESKRLVAKAKYERHATQIVRIHYSKPEKELRNNGKTILDALKSINLHSSFVRAEINKYLEDGHAEGSYFNIENLDDCSMPPTFQGMSDADREVLNLTYILLNMLMQAGQQGRQSKEETVNSINDSKIQDAEDAQHEVEMQLVRNKRLQYKLQFIIDYYQSLNETVTKRNGQSKKLGTELSSVQFSDVEFSALVDISINKARRAPPMIKRSEQQKNLAVVLRESLNERPIETAKKLLLLLKKRHDTLRATKKVSMTESMKTMENRFLHSINRNSDTIKQNEQPFFFLENLLQDILYVESRGEPLESCLMAKNDDVSTQLSYENGLVMQIEAIRWHKDAFELLQIGVTATQREKLLKLLQVAKIFFDLNMNENGCTRANNGNFTGLVMYGNEWIYAALRLYHVLLVRLHSAYLQAEVDTADWEFRKHCNEVGKARLTAENPHAYLSEETKEALGYKQMKLPPTEGTPEEKMGRFLQAVKKKEKKSRSDVYSVHNFENDVIWAVGAQGNKFFTMPRILMRIRAAVSKIEVTYLELFKKYSVEMRNGIANAQEKYEEEASGHATEWLFKFQCRYSDSFIDDEWGSIGESGNVGRVNATILKEATFSGESYNKLKKGRRSLPSPHGAKPVKKKRRSKLDWSSR